MSERSSKFSHVRSNRIAFDGRKDKSLPYGFGWVLDGKLGGMALPTDPEQIKNLEHTCNVGMICSLVELENCPPESYFQVFMDLFYPWTWSFNRIVKCEWDSAEVANPLNGYSHSVRFKCLTNNRKILNFHNKMSHQLEHKLQLLETKIFKINHRISTLGVPLIVVCEKINNLKPTCYYY